MRWQQVFNGRYLKIMPENRSPIATAGSKNALKTVKLFTDL